MSIVQELFGRDRALVGMVHFAGDWWAFHRSTSRTQLVDRLCDLAWSGLAGIGLEDPTDAT